MPWFLNQQGGGGGVQILKCNSPIINVLPQPKYYGRIIIFVKYGGSGDFKLFVPWQFLDTTLLFGVFLFLPPPHSIFQY